MDAPSSLLAAMPPSDWMFQAIAAVLLAAGLVIWLAGYRLMRFVVGVVGMLVGAGMALAIAQTPLASIAGPAPVHLMLLGGGLIGLIVGLLAYRPVMATTAGVTLAALGIVVTGFVLDVRDRNPRNAAADNEPASVALVQLKDAASQDLEAYINAHADDRSDSADADLLRLLDDQTSTAAPVQPSAEDRAPSTGMFESLTASLATKAAAERSSSRVEQMAQSWTSKARDWWMSIPDARRPTIALVGAVMLAMGFLMGLTATQWAGGLLSGPLGAAMWLPGAGLLASSFHPSIAGLLDRPLWQWTIVWLGVAMIGIAWQWWGLLHKKSRPAGSEG